MNNPVHKDTQSVWGGEEQSWMQAATSHVECTARERAAMGIPEGLVRYSTGIEDTRDLIADLTQALEGI